MATLHRARVCMIGSEEDMCNLCRVMLENYGNIDDEDDELPPTSLQELKQKIDQYAREDGAEFDTFLYQMISETRFGSAESGTLRFEITKQKCELWTALFSYDSYDSFQIHEWLELHNRSGQILTVVQKAAWDFGLEKGEVIITAGQILDDWNTMGECWMWLIPKYEYGYPPEEAVERLKKLKKTLLREEFDMSISELLRSCKENLKEISMTVQNPEEIKMAIRSAKERRDYPELADLYHIVAESVLWETEHNARWTACLDAIETLWLEKYDDE